MVLMRCTGLGCSFVCEMCICVSICVFILSGCIYCEIKYNIGYTEKWIETRLKYT